MPIEPWLHNARSASRLELDVQLRVVSSFYFGPENGFSKHDWETLREPVGVTLPSAEEWLSATRALACLDDVAEHFRRLAEIAARRERPLRPGAPEHWMRPSLSADGTFVAGFAWTDSYGASVAILDAIRAETEGTLFSDVDQCWQLCIEREGDRIWIGERDDPFGGDPGRVVVVPREVAVAAASAAHTRIDRVMEALVDRVGADPWCFALARKYRAAPIP